MRIKIEIATSFYRGEGNNTIGYAYNVYNTSNGQNNLLFSRRGSTQNQSVDVEGAKMYSIYKALRRVNSKLEDVSPVTIQVITDDHSKRIMQNQNDEYTNLVESVAENFYNVTYDSGEESELKLLKKESSKASKRILDDEEHDTTIGFNNQ